MRHPVFRSICRIVIPQGLSIAICCAGFAMTENCVGQLPEASRQQSLAVVDLLDDDAHGRPGGTEREHGGRGDARAAQEAAGALEASPRRSVDAEIGCSVGR